MKNINNKLTPIFISMIAIGSIWFVTDLESNTYVWKVSRFALFDRFYAFVLVTIFSYIFYAISLKISKHYTKKSNKKIQIKEYLIILLIAVVMIIIGVLYATFIINKQDFSWVELGRGCCLAVPIFLIHYTIVRNNKIMEEYTRQALQMEKIRGNQLETELKYLRAQYHPHFLFNALNTIYFQIEDENKTAKHSVELLSDLLRYQLYDINKEVTMDQEIKYIKSYIEFQRLRMSDRLVLDTYFDTEIKEQTIHPLLFQPLIENAFKYVRNEYWIKLEFRLHENQIQFTIENSISEKRPTNKKKGIGIENLERRLQLLYPDKYNLETKLLKNVFTAQLTINID